MIEPHPIDPLSAALFALAFAAALALSHRRPSWGVVLLLLSGPFDFHRDLLRTTVTLPKVVLLALAAALVLRRAPFKVLWTPRARPLAAGAIAICAATALSAVPGIYIDAVARETLKALEYALIFACCTVACTLDPDERPIRIGFLAAGALVCLSGFAESFGGARSMVSIAGNSVPRIAGALEGPNQLSGYLGLVIPVLFGFAFLRRDRTALAVALVASLCLTLTLSRAGVAAGVIELIFFAAFVRPAGARVLAGSLVVLGALSAAALFALGGLSRLGSLTEYSAPTGLASRSALWSAAFELWKRSPLLGVGAGNYELLLPTVGLEGVRTHPNSGYLQALVEGGLPLFAAVLWTTYASIASFVRDARRDPVVLGALAGSVGLAFHQIFDSMTFFVKIGELWWLILGVASARTIMLASRCEPAPRPAGGYPR